MAIDRAEVRRISRLAHLELDDAAIDSLTRDLESILEHVATLDELDVDSIRPWTRPGVESALREDVPTTSLTQDEALANAPDDAGGHFRVPRVLDA